LVISASTQSV